MLKNRLHNLKVLMGVLMVITGLGLSSSWGSSTQFTQEHDPLEDMRSFAFKAAIVSSAVAVMSLSTESVIDILCNMAEPHAGPGLCVMVPLALHATTKIGAYGAASFLSIGAGITALEWAADGIHALGKLLLGGRAALR